MSISGLGFRLLHTLTDQFVEIIIPIDEAMLGLGSDVFRTDEDYDIRPKEQCERVFLKVADIFESPNPNQIYIELRYEQLDYGYHY